MQARKQALLFRDPLQKRRQSGLFRVRKRSQQIPAVFAGDSANGFHPRLALVRQVQRVGAAVARMRPPLDQSARLQIIHQGHQPAGHRSKSRREFLVAEGGCGRENSEDPGMGRNEIRVALRLRAPRLS